MDKIDGFQVIFHLIKLFFWKIIICKYQAGIILKISSDSIHQEASENA